MRTYGLYLVCIPTVNEELSTAPSTWRRDVKSINLLALNRDGFALRNYTTRTVYCEQELRRGYKAYIDDEVLYRDAGVAATKKIDVICKIRYMAEHERIDLSKVDEMSAAKPLPEITEMGEEMLADGFEDLVNNPKYSDLTIIVGGGPANVDTPSSVTTSIANPAIRRTSIPAIPKTPTTPTTPSTPTASATIYPPQQTFHAHKAILCTRSSFFSRLCDTPMRETLTNTVRLPEDDPRTFATLLRYFYTDRYTDQDADIPSPEGLPASSAGPSASTSTSASSTSTLLGPSATPLDRLHAHRARVFVAADKYGALKLKKHVRAVMIRSLSVETLVHVVRFAYGTAEAGEDEELRNAVAVFTARQMGRLKLVPEFKELIESGGRYAKFAFDVMDKLDAMRVT